jgi:hypothetical protein
LFLCSLCSIPHAVCVLLLNVIYWAEAHESRYIKVQYETLLCVGKWKTGNGMGKEKRE